MSLILQDVDYTYPGSASGLHGVSMHVEPGELVAVIGPSGSGKTTLLKLVAGLERGHQGSITLNGEDLAAKPVHQRNIGVVFQSYALFPHMNVLDNIAYGLKLRDVDRAARHRRARELLEIVGMAGFGERRVAQLSGGQQQRVALARALAINPSALLLDEPMAALDASIRGHLRDQVRQLQRRFEATTLLVTHDQEEALVMADRVAVMHEGRLLQIATPRTLYEEPADRTVAQFVGLSTLLPATVCAPDRLDLGFAQWAAPTGARRVGEAVHVMVRPEHVQADPPEGAVNRLRGRRGIERFLGAVCRYDFHLPSCETPLLVESRALADAAIAVEPRHLRLLDA